MFYVNDKICLVVNKERLLVRTNTTWPDELMKTAGCRPIDFTGKLIKGLVFVDAEVLTTKKKLAYRVKMALAYNKIAKASKKKMKYSLERSYEILDRTPVVLQSLLSGLYNDWVMNNEGPETYSPYDVVGHLIHGEKTDWTARIKMIMQFDSSKTFVRWNREAMYEESKGRDLLQLLDEFAELRKENMIWFRSLNLTEADFDRKGMHPVLGAVTLRHLLATWVVHDLTHIAQITRVMAKQYKEETGPWIEFFRILEF